MFSHIRSIQARDAAKPSIFEVIIAYPGYHAVKLHNVSRLFWCLRLKALARFWAHIIRHFTGIEIHPAVKLGKRLFIDHGMGVVIGETAEIGDDVTMYHGVTLGGRGGTDTGRRHPKVCNEAMIGAGAQVLGPITIGDRARIGANAVVIKDVPECCTAIGNPARIVHSDSQRPCYGFPVGRDLDPVGEVIEMLVHDVQTLKDQLELMQDQDDESKETFH